MGRVAGAAAGQTVTVLDALPVSHVGKTYKSPLSVIATSRELAEGLKGTAGVPAGERCQHAAAATASRPSNPACTN